MLDIFSQLLHFFKIFNKIDFSLGIFLIQSIMASNNIDGENGDVAILDITADSNDDQTPILSDNVQPNDSTLLTPVADTIRIPSITRFRLTNILRALLVIEFLTILIIWLAGKLY